VISWPVKSRWLGEAAVSPRGRVVVALQTDGLQITRSQFDTVFERFDQKTFGQLMKDARAKIQIPVATETLLAEALAKRNWLAHGFFADHAAAFMTEHGRVQMMDELRGLVRLFQRADGEVGGLYKPILQRRGVTEEAVPRIAAEMVAGFLTASNSVNQN